MKSDRRTLVVLGVLFAFLAISQPFRSLFLFGARLALHQVTLSGLALVSSSNEDDFINLGAWSMTTRPERSGSTRDETLGLAIVQTMDHWNHTESDGQDAIKPLEDYCRAHPDDLAAHAHLLRLALNISTLKEARDKDRLVKQAARLELVAAKCEERQAENWYWRDRRFHLLMLLGRKEDATKVYIAQPLPTSFEDYVSDEVKCKEALYRGQYFDLPQSAMVSLWAETLYPHFNSFAQLSELTKTSPDSLKLRVAQIEYGRALITSCPTPIAGLVGVREIRHGLWNSRQVGEWKKQFKAEEQANVEELYKQTVSAKEWDHCVKIAKQDVVLRFLHPDENLTALYIGQLGPVVVTTSILAGIVALVSFGLACRGTKTVANPYIGWGLLLATSVMGGLSWGSWRYLHHYSLGNSFFMPLLIALFGWAAFRTWRSDTPKKVIPIALLFVALLFGLTVPSWQASSIIFLLLYALQGGKMPLSPWVSAIGMTLVAYHTALNAAYANSFLGIAVGSIVAMGGLLATTKRNLEPDEPRLPGLTLAAAVAVLGIFMLTQYDKAMVSNMQSELDQAVKIRSELAKL